MSKCIKVWKLMEWLRNWWGDMHLDRLKDKAERSMRARFMKMLKTRKKTGPWSSGWEEAREAETEHWHCWVCALGVPGADVWRADWEKRGWREQEGAGATVQGVGWRVTMEMAKTDPRVIWGTKRWCKRWGWEVKMIPKFLVWTTEGHWYPSLRWEGQRKHSLGEKMLCLISEMSGCRYHLELEGRS